MQRSGQGARPKAAGPEGPRGEPQCGMRGAEPEGSAAPEAMRTEGGMKAMSEGPRAQRPAEGGAAP